MKILSVAIPCYNSAAYMKRAIDSALPGGDEIEIIIVDDGSSDNTREIGLEYAEKYPNIVRIISQENGGHGSAVNAGLMNARGLYYKVLDSDDWFDKNALLKVLALLRNLYISKNSIDMLICNYVYEKPSAGKRRTINYRSAMPVGELFGWAELKHFKLSQNILMHSVIYRTKVLLDCALQLPRHTFYVDNIFVYQPLPYVKTMYYLDVDLYRYYIGREDQSVNESIMIKRIDQQIRVTKIMIDAYDLANIKEKKLQNYMVKYLTMMMTVSSALLVKSGTPECLEKRDNLWMYLKDQSPAVAKLMQWTLLNRPMQMKTKAGRRIIIYGYELSKKIFGFS